MIVWFKRRRAGRVLINAGICPKHDIQRELLPYGVHDFDDPYRSCPECMKELKSAREHNVAWARKTLGLD